MQTATSVDELRALSGPDARHAVTIGNFDGVHMGHRALIHAARLKAREHDALSVAITFTPHPVYVLRQMHPEKLTPLPRKLELLQRTGIDAVLVLPFTEDMAQLEAESFVSRYLVDGLSLTDLIIGFNFALGRDRKGDLPTLRTHGARWGFGVTRVQPVIVGNETVSSSLIRERIRSGDVDKARPLLGRPHSVDGEVVHGEGRGRKLGFPTANVAYGGVLLPPLGAYATWVEILPENGGEAALHPAMTSVGTNPTFGGNQITLETNILDFSGDLYGRTVRVHFMTRLRGEIQFSGVDALCERLRQDAVDAKEYLTLHSLEPENLFGSTFKEPL